MVLLIYDYLLIVHWFTLNPYNTNMKDVELRTPLWKR